MVVGDNFTFGRKAAGDALATAEASATEADRAGRAVQRPERAAAECEDRQQRQSQRGAGAERASRDRASRLVTLRDVLDHADGAARSVVRPEEDLGPAEERLRRFLEQYWGGPTTYSQLQGHPRLRMRHAPFAVTPEMRDRWLTHMRAAVLSLGLPDGDGLAVLSELRRRSDPLPVLVLTARNGLQDRVNGLRSGADDYLAKPFALEELVARLEAILRRPGQLLGSSLKLANLVYDTESRQIFVDDQPKFISSRETSVLEILLRRQGRVVPKKNVEDHIFGLSGEVASNAVEVYVSRLRKLLAKMARNLAPPEKESDEVEAASHSSVA